MSNTLLNILKEKEKESLKKSDIERLLNYETKVFLYTDLVNFKSLEDVFEKKSSIIILFQTTDRLYGHYTALFKRDKQKTLHYFDSYGLNIDQDLRHSPFILHQDNPTKYALSHLIDNFLKRSNYKLITNKYRVQQMNNRNTTQNGINTCGRHVIMRINFSYLDDFVYYNLITNSTKLNSDLFVSLSTITI